MNNKKVTTNLIKNTTLMRKLIAQYWVLKVGNALSLQISKEILFQLIKV